MGSARSKFTAEYKQEAVELVINNEDATIAGVAADLGLAPQTLGSWVRKVRESLPEADESEPLNESERRELVRLRAEHKEQEKRLQQQDMELRFAKQVAACVANAESWSILLLLTGRPRVNSLFVLCVAHWGCQNRATIGGPRAPSQTASAATRS